ncbi:MAG: hypothetical protein LC107_02940 [Chitinophagales bacterium]|nr:hypothetical protein [Chitinophagales bacterium]
MKTRLPNITVFFVGFALIWSSCKNDYTYQPTDWSKEKLIGEVSKITTTIFSAINENDTVIRGEAIRPIEDFYNPQGYKTEIFKYYSGGALNQKELYTYDKYGFMLTKKVYNAENNLRFRTEHKYDNRGNQTEVIYYDYRDNITSRVVYFYDFSDNMIEEISYIHGDSLAYKKTFKNNENGLKVEEYVYNSEEEIGHYTRYKYDSHGNETELKYFNPDGTANMIIKYHYDKYQNITDEVFYRPDSLIARWNYEYRFDDRGNWISKTRFMNNNGLDIFERKIEYYK